MSSSIIIPAIIISVSVLYSFTLPLFGNVSDLSQEKSKYENILDQVQNVDSKQKTLSQEFEKLTKNDVEKIEKIIPSSYDFVKIATDINAIASKYGISIEKVSSSKKVNDVASVGEAEVVESLYNSATLDIEFKASYPKFNSLMADLERSLRILDIKSVQLQTENENIYSYKVAFDVYWLN